MEKESHLRKEINTLRYKRQNLINEIKQKRNNADDLRDKRDSLNTEVKDLVNQGKEHLKKRDEFQKKVRELKEKRSGITKGIKPKADQIRSEKEERRKLNRAAHASEEEIVADFDASLKTLFEMDLSLRDEVIMVEMVMDVQKRYLARKNADTMSQEIHETWKGIKEIEEEATGVTTEIITLASKGEEEHQFAMELFDKKNELSNQGQECHENYMALVKDIRSTSRQIDVLSKDIDHQIKEIKPMQKNLDRVRITRREEQRLEQLKTAKQKMDTSGKIDLNDLRVLLETKSIDVGSKGKQGRQGRQGKQGKQGKGDRKMGMEKGKIMEKEPETRKEKEERKKKEKERKMKKVMEKKRKKEEREMKKELEKGTS